MGMKKLFWLVLGCCFLICGCPKPVIRTYYKTSSLTPIITQIGALLELDLPPNVYLPMKEEVRIRYNVAIALMDEGELRDALKQLHWLVINKPSWWIAHFDYARCWYNLGGDPKEVIAHLEESIRLRPTNPRAYFMLGFVNEDQGNCGAALVYYKRSLEFRPDEPESWYRFGRCSYQQGDLPAAKKAFTEVLSYREDLSTLVGLATVYEELNDNTGAEALYLRIVHLHSDLLMSYRYLIDFYIRTGQETKAAQVEKKIRPVGKDRKLRPLR